MKSAASLELQAAFGSRVWMCLFGFFFVGKGEAKRILYTFGSVNGCQSTTGRLWSLISR